MNKINITIVSSSRYASEECLDLIEGIPDFRVIARPADLSGQATWLALANTDVVIVDESAIRQEGFAALQLLLDSYPDVKCLVLIEKYNEDKMIWTMLRGVRGVMCGDERHRLLPKAIRYLHVGEIWMSRDLLKPFRHAAQSLQQWSVTGGVKEANWMKLH